MSMTFVNGHILFMAFGLMCVLIAGAFYLATQAFRVLSDLDFCANHVQHAVRVAEVRTRYGSNGPDDDEILERFGGKR